MKKKKKHCNSILAISLSPRSRPGVRHKIDIHFLFLSEFMGWMIIFYGLFPCQGGKTSFPAHIQYYQGTRKPMIMKFISGL